MFGRVPARAASLSSPFVVLFSALLALAEPPAAVDGVPKTVCLLEGNTWQIGWEGEKAGPRDYRSDLLMRQLLRQALLIAARDELGLVTRDEAIGDRMPADAKLSLVMGCRHRGKRRGILLKRPVKGMPEQVRDFQCDSHWSYVVTLSRAEELSRTWFVEALGKEGYSGTRNRWKPEAKVPDAVEGLLSEMTFTSQFHALRLLHEAIRREGESETLAGALVRGYANLGLLTENQWLMGPNVFKARALLYAQRMVARGEHFSWATWHRAYALTAAGLHAKALADLDAAEKSEPPKDKEDALAARPAWAGLLRAHCRFEMDKMDWEKLEPPLRELAELLRLVNVELTNGVIRTKDTCGRVQSLERANSAVEAMPECYRAHDSLCSYSQVGNGHTATLAGIVTMGQKLYGRLDAMPGLPVRVRTMIAPQVSAQGSNAAALSPPEECAVRAKVIATLMDVDDTNPSVDKGEGEQAKKGNETGATMVAGDRGEPSWATLGYLIRETSFLQIYRRARFMKRTLSISPDSFLQATMPMVESHPLRTYLETLTFDRLAERDAAQRSFKLNLRNLNLNATPVYYAMRTIDRKRARPITWYFTTNSDGGARQIAVRFGYSYPYEKERAQHLHAVSPYCPFGRALLIKHDWDAVAGDAAQWEKDAIGRAASVLGELTRKYYRLGRSDDMIRCLRETIDVSPDMSLYRALASHYAGRKETAKAIATLKEYLEKPDHGLGHSVAQMTIAGHYMNDGQWEEALPYAEQAAETYSAGSLDCLAECHEGMGQWDRAEAGYRAVAERYRDSVLTWYFFCKRTGHGNLDAAEQAVGEYLRDPRVASTAEAAKADVGTWSGGVLNSLGTYYLLTKKPKEACECFRIHFLRSTETTSLGVFAAGLAAALAADEVGDSKGRDELLQQIIKRGDTQIPPSPGRRNIWSRLAELMADDLAAGGKGRIATPVYDGIVKGLSLESAVCYHCFFAKYLQLHGQEKKAIHYWKRCLACRPMYCWPRTLAGAELVTRGYRPDCYQTLKKEKEAS